jgi:hypothetical protein
MAFQATKTSPSPLVAHKISPMIASSFTLNNCAFSKQFRNRRKSALRHLVVELFLRNPEAANAAAR